ncbi:hypothetical protein ACUY2G_12260 [Corynebacterium guaraldiae]|uniref:hypothetical protein n=1 Tax=Corynebacterium sp. MSK004 TaxID=3050186 RepID=UPI00254FDA9E|nr:hypothetical protein [Corynebacterium sp. MSK004]MDK8898159.1 hypothetical protein [Corynebacterium sp. MSK004]
MTNPTREDIIRAHDALDAVCDLVTELRGFSANVYRNLILAALPPRPQPTMAEIEWDDDEHYLAEAEHKSCGKVIMLGPDEEGLIEFFIPEACASRYDAAYPGSLTLTGRRYELAEVQDD